MRFFGWKLVNIKDIDALTRRVAQLELRQDLPMSVRVPHENPYHYEPLYIPYRSEEGYARTRAATRLSINDVVERLVRVVGLKVRDLPSDRFVDPKPAPPTQFYGVDFGTKQDTPKPKKRR